MTSAPWKVTHSSDPAASADLHGTPRRSRTPRVLGNLGGILLLLTVPILGFLALDTISYRYWPADADFRAGQTAHVATVGDGETFILWRYHPYDAPDCSVTAVPSGEAIELRDVSSESWMRGAGASPYVGFAEGRSTSDVVSVSCTSTLDASSSIGADEFLYIDGPHGPAWFDSLGPLWPAAIGLVASAVTMLGLAVILRSRPV